MITLEQYYMGRDEKYADELTGEIQAAAVKLLTRVNNLLAIIDIDQAEVSSGWRPMAINQNIGGAKRSNHMTGHAVDVVDADKRIANAILKDPEVLDFSGLYLENPAYTANWVHIQDVAPHSGKRIFKP